MDTNKQATKFVTKQASRRLILAMGAAGLAFGYAVKAMQKLQEVLPREDIQEAAASNGSASEALRAQVISQNMD